MSVNPLQDGIRFSARAQRRAKALREARKMGSEGPTKRTRTPTAKAREATANGQGLYGLLGVEQDMEEGTAQMQPLLKTIFTTVTQMMEVHKQEQEARKQEQEARRRENETWKQLFMELRAELARLSQAQAEMQAQIQAQGVQISTNTSPTYAAVARTPPTSQPSNLLSISNAIPSTITDTLYCTIDTARVPEEEKGRTRPKAVREAIEKEIRSMEGQMNWSCVAVTMDPRNTSRIRVTCRDEEERARVKEAAKKAGTAGSRLLRDQLYPVKLDNAFRPAVLTQEGDIRKEVMKELGEENRVEVAKMAWLSDKTKSREYGSMVVYLTKGSDAARILQEGYFHLNGESAYAHPFEIRYGPTQCYRCQGLNHKAQACKKEQVCAKCASTGHTHKECSEIIPKCALCGGAHESFSKNCQVLHPHSHE